MMNKVIKSFVVFLVACVTFTGCNKESDVIGLNEATKYGSIKVILEGKRPDGEDFSLTRTFRFAPSNGPAGSSEVYTYVDDAVTYRSYYVTRYLGAINQSVYDEENVAELRLYVEEDESDELNFIESGFYLRTSVTTSDKQYFDIYESIWVNDDDVKKYQYNPETGKFTFEYETLLNENSTGFPLQVTVQANVTVFESLHYNQF